MNVVSELVSQERLYNPLLDAPRWTVKSVLGPLRRRAGLIALTTLACVALAVAYLLTTPSSYTATSVLVTDTKQTPPSPSQVTSELLIDPAVIESQIEVLKSDRIAQEVVERLHLDSDPEFVGSGPSLSKRLVASLLHQPLAEPSAQARKAIAVDSLVSKVKVLRIGHSYLAEIAVTTKQPARSAEIANAVADSYIQDQLDGRMLSNQRTDMWMKKRVGEVQAQADSAAALVEDFRRQHASELGATGNGGATTTASEPATQASEPAITPDQAATQLKALTLAAASARNDYESLQNRYVRLTQFMQQQSLPVTEARLLTSAEPPLNKSAPKSAVILLLATIGGIMAGIGLALLRETLDRRIRWPHQIKEDLGLPLAGSLPYVQRGRAIVRSGEEQSVSRIEARLMGRPRSGWVALFDSLRPWCAATQTLRTIKLAVDQTNRRNAGMVIGIVSPWPGEGKSTLAYNLASMLAETGARVLVLDGDLNSPALSKSLAPQADRGLAELLDGAPIADCVSRTDAGFDVVGVSGGSVPLHAFHILGSVRMQRALAAAQGAYGYTVVDLPAMLTSVDTQAIAGFVDAFVLTTAFGRTTIDDVEEALATSEIITGRIVATVLNKSRSIDRSSRRAMRARRPVEA